MEQIDYFTAERLAVALIALVGGFLVSFFFVSRGFRGFLTFLAAVFVIGLILIGLTRGSSPFLETITYNLTDYVYWNPLGTFAFVAGLGIGLVTGRRRSRD